MDQEKEVETILQELKLRCTNTSALVDKMCTDKFLIQL
jgi:hypothetical protein